MSAPGQIHGGVFTAMSDRDRSEFVALVAVVCTVVVFLIGLGAGGYYRESDQQQSAQGNRPSLQLLEGSPKSYQAICNSPLNETHADLCQQWRATEAATNSAGWTQAQFWVGLIGLGGLVATVIYAIRSYRHGVSSSQIQYRAYINIAGISVKVGANFDSIDASLEFKNAGQTPAKNASIVIWWAIEPKPFDSSWHSEIRDVGSTSSLGAGASGYVPLHISPLSNAELTAEQIRDAFDGVLGFWIYGTITYEDVFGHKHWTRFRYEWMKRPGETVPQMRHSKEGNEISD